MIGGVVSNWDVKIFQPIACESFPVLSDEALCDVSNEQYYAYQICWSIIHEALDPDLQFLEVRPSCYSRWLALGCRILRHYVPQDKPNLTLAFPLNFVLRYIFQTFLKSKQRIQLRMVQKIFVLAWEIHTIS